MQAEYNAKRKLYMDNRITYQEFYLWIIEWANITSNYLLIDIDILKASNGYPFNDIPLRMWDAHNDIIRQKMARMGIKNFSLSDIVCIVKNLARMILSNQEKENKQEDEDNINNNPNNSTIDIL